MARYIAENMLDPAINLGGLEGELISTTTHAAVINKLYVADNASQVVFTLPATCAVGDRVGIVGLGAGGWAVKPNTGDTIRDGNGDEIDDTESVASDAQYSAVELVCTVANSQWGIRAARNLVLQGSFTPTEGMYVGGDNTPGSADSVIYTQLFSTDATTTEGNTLITARRQSSGVETTVGHSYAAGGKNAGGSDLQNIEKIVNSSRSSSSLGNVLSAAMSDMFGCRSSIESYTIGAYIGGGDTNIVNKVVWSTDSWSNLGAVLVTTLGDQGGVYNTTHGYSGGGSRGGTFRTTGISKFSLASETEANIGAVLSTTSVRQEGIQDIVADLGWFVGGDNTTVQKLDMSGDTTSQPSSILAVREGPASASSLTHGYVAAGAPTNKNTVDKLDFSNDSVAATTVIATATREMAGLTI